MVPVSTLLAGAAFVAMAAINVVVMLEASRPTCIGKAKSRLIAIHRIGGYLFAITLCIMVWIMIQRLVGVGLSKLSADVLHVAIAIVLVPLLGLKILIARRYKHLHSLLMPLGLAIFAATFALVSLPVLLQALRPASPDSVGLRVTLVLAVVLSLSLCRLAVMRPKKQRDGTADSLSIPPVPVASACSTNSKGATTMTLLLAHIEQQTHDTKTFRFLIPRERSFQAKPGQFLTFHWAVEGKRVLRSYTISSSPTHPNYVEITSKRVKDGCISNFLHEQAKLGLTVEASGPHGKFYLDEMVHRRIVLIAAGSGITPMISIIRYIEDLHLPIIVTLLYCVRTHKDIIFEAELERLRNSVPNFNYGVSLSQPDDAWLGQRGHLTREFIFEHVIDLNTPTFFLCGPKGFMENAWQILTSVGVDESRITQESFGERPADSTQVVSQVATVEFARSKKICEVPNGATLLDVAEANGVQIPYGCREGQCGTCATRVLCGTVRMDTDTGLSADQKKAGYVLPCVSRAEGIVVVAG